MFSLHQMLLVNASTEQEQNINTAGLVRYLAMVVSSTSQQNSNLVWATNWGLLLNWTFYVKNTAHRLKKSEQYFLLPLKTRRATKRLIKKASYWQTTISESQHHILRDHRSHKNQPFLKLFSLNQSNVKVFKKVSRFKTWAIVDQNTNMTAEPLSNRIFLNQKSILEHITAAVSSTISTPTLLADDTQDLFFVNMYKKVSWKMREARYAHWNLQTRGTLNEWRYNKLLGSELQTSNIGCFEHTYSTINHLIGPVSVKHLARFLNLNIIKLTSNKIPNGLFTYIEYPLKLLGLQELKDRHKYWNFTIYRAKKLIYGAHRRTKTTKTVGRIIKKFSLEHIETKSNTWHDPASCVALVFKSNENSKKITKKSLLNNTTLSLNNWRFRFD